MSGINKWIGIGYVGADAELRQTQNGTAVLNFRVAVTEKWRTQSGENQEHTEWVTCVLWGNRAEALAQYLTKGTRVCVEGSMRTSSYDDKEGIKRYKTEINLREVELLGSPRDDAGGRDGDQQQRGGGQQQQRDEGGRQQRSEGGGQQQQRGGNQQRQPQNQQQGGYQGGRGAPPQQQQRGGGGGRGAPQQQRQQQRQAPPPDDFGYGPDDDIPF